MTTLQSGGPPRTAPLPPERHGDNLLDGDAALLEALRREGAERIRAGLPRARRAARRAAR